MAKPTPDTLPQPKPYLMVVYGKDGCDRCAALKEEVFRLIAENGLGDMYDAEYQNLSTAEGMAAFAIARTVNGQRIPALQILKYHEGDDTYRPIPDPRPERRDEKTGRFFVPAFLQLETDYGAPASGIGREDILALVSLAGSG